MQHAYFLAGPGGLLSFSHVNVEGGLQRGLCSEVERTGCLRGDHFRRGDSVWDDLSRCVSRTPGIPTGLES